jgi:hypothetical protein
VGVRDVIALVRFHPMLTAPAIAGLFSVPQTAMHYRPQSARENLRPRIWVCTANERQVYFVSIKLYLAWNGELVGAIRKYFKTMKECFDAREEAIKLILQSNEDKKYYYVDGGCSIAGYVTDEEWNRISSEQEKNGEYWPPGMIRGPFPPPISPSSACLDFAHRET